MQSAKRRLGMMNMCADTKTRALGIHPLLLTLLIGLAVLFSLPIAVFGVALTSIFLFPAGPTPPFRIFNDTGDLVHVVACARGEAPTPLEIEPQKYQLFTDRWLPPADPGFACFLRSASFKQGACLAMPTTGSHQYEFRVSKADPTKTEKQCFNHSATSL